MFNQKQCCCILFCFAYLYANFILSPPQIKNRFLSSPPRCTHILFNTFPWSHGNKHIQSRIIIIITKPPLSHPRKESQTWVPVFPTEICSSRCLVMCQIPKLVSKFEADQLRWSCRVEIIPPPLKGSLPLASDYEGGRLRGVLPRCGLETKASPTPPSPHLAVAVKKKVPHASLLYGLGFGISFW